MEKIKKTLFSTILISCLISSSLLVTSQSLAADTITDQMIKTISGSQLSLPSGGTKPEEKAQEFAGKLIGAFLSLFGIIFMVLMIYGGYIWMDARGREEELQKAKDIIRSAIIGLIIVMIAYLITYFVVSRLQTAMGL